MADNLYKLTDFVNLKTNLSSGNPTWLGVVLPEDLAAKLVPIAQTAKNEGDEFILSHFKEAQLAGLLSAGHIGYIQPRQVNSYFRGDENRENPPDGLLHQVIINFEDEWTPTNIGTYTYFLPVGFGVELKPGISPGKPDHSNSYPLHILSGQVERGARVSLEYITEDCSGKFIPIGESLIERYILGAVAYAGNLIGHRGGWREQLEKAEHLTLAAGFGYVTHSDLHKQIAEAWKECERIASVDPSEERRREKTARSIFNGTPAYKVALTDSLEQLWHEGMKKGDIWVIPGRGNEGGVDFSQYPYGTLERLSTQAVIELMNHFSRSGLTLTQIQNGMKIDELK